jgi:hypothetical protein
MAQADDSPAAVTDDEAEEYWLHLLLRHNGYYQVVGEDDNWTVAHQMTGETGRLFACVQSLMEALIAMRHAFTSDGTGGQHKACRMADAAIRKATGGSDE